MSKITFENYGIRASQIDDPTVVAGRYSFQKEAERLVAADVAQKLQLKPTDSLLEIGFGAGALSVPLSFAVDHVTVVDHSSVVARFQSGFAGLKNVTTVAGNFLDLPPLGTFSKILIYGVMQCLSDANEVYAFIDKALAHLRPGGMLLVGDVPNTDRKTRFLNSETGKEINAQWPKNATADMSRFNLGDMAQDTVLVDIGDDLILAILKKFRSQGFEVYTLPERPELPFGMTREDLLFVKHK